MKCKAHELSIAGGDQRRATLGIIIIHRPRNIIVSSKAAAWRSPPRGASIGYSSRVVSSNKWRENMRHILAIKMSGESALNLLDAASRQKRELMKLWRENMISVNIIAALAASSL